MNSPARRSWIPRPLRSLAILLAALVLVSAGWTYAYARNRLAALDYVTNHGGHVELSGYPAWWPERATFPLPTWLRTCSEVHIKDSRHCDLRRVAPLHEITHLLLSCDVPDAEFQRVGSFRRLEWLDANKATTITDSGLEALRSCRRLRELHLGSKRITDSGLNVLAGLPLAVLFLDETNITDAGLRHLADLPLNTLVLNGTRVSSTGLGHLAHTPLRCLWLDRTQVNDAGIAMIAHHSLEILSLEETSVTPEGLLRLRGMKWVTLILRTPRFAEEDGASLRDAGLHVVLVRADRTVVSK